MNVAQLIERVCAQLSVDELTQQEGELALGYLNEGYDELMRVYRPTIDLRAFPDEQGRLGQEQLGEYAGRIIALYRGGEPVAFKRVDGVVTVSGGGGALTARCRYLTPELEGKQDVPELPNAFHGALADYATWRMLGNGGRARQQRGDMYFARYLQRRATLPAESAQWRESIIDKYWAATGRG